MWTKLFERKNNEAHSLCNYGVGYFDFPEQEIALMRGYNSFVVKWVTNTAERRLHMSNVPQQININEEDVFYFIVSYLQDPCS